MTKKDYERTGIAIAQAMREAKSEKELTAMWKVVEHISHAFESDNPRFLADRFTTFIAKQSGEAPQ